jgi:hypothetical protein
MLAAQSGTRPPATWFLNPPIVCRLSQRLEKGGTACVIRAMKQSICDPCRKMALE